MKNVTVAIPEDLARWARHWAAEHESSVSGLLSRLLQEKREKESLYQTSMDRFLSNSGEVLSDGSALPSRDSLYER